MNHKTILKIHAALLLVLAFSSCTLTTEDPVFFALQYEESFIDDRAFPDEAVVQRIVTDGTRYFAAAGALYWRSTGNWSQINPPESGALCTNVELFGTRLWAAFMRVDNTGLGLFYRLADLSDSWTHVVDADLAGDVKVGLLKAANGILFVGTLNAGATHNLYYSTVFPDFSPTNLTALTLADGPVIDIEWNTSSYFVTVYRTLYSGTVALNDFAPYSGAVVPTSTDPFGGLYYSTTSNTLYLAADARFYTKTGAADWVPGTEATVDGEGVQFTCFVELPAGLGGDVYAGTVKHGYYVTGTLTRQPSYTYSLLYEGGILSMLIDASDSLFLGTAGAGLWRGTFSSGTWSWKQE